MQEELWLLHSALQRRAHFETIQTTQLPVTADTKASMDQTGRIVH